MASFIPWGNQFYTIIRTQLIFVPCLNAIIIVVAKTKIIIIFDNDNIELPIPVKLIERSIKFNNRVEITFITTLFYNKQFLRSYNILSAFFAILSQLNFCAKL